MRRIIGAVIVVGIVGGVLVVLPALTIGIKAALLVLAIDVTIVALLALGVWLMNGGE